MQNYTLLYRKECVLEKRYKKRDLFIYYKTILFGTQKLDILLANLDGF